MKSKGVDLIAQERQEQIEKHGWHEGHDENEHDTGELEEAALWVLDPEKHKYPFDDVDEPDSFYHKMNAKRDNPIERLKIAGALLAAELDRLFE